MLRWQVKAKTRIFEITGILGCLVKVIANWPSEELPVGKWGFVASCIFGPRSNEALEGAGWLWLHHFRASCALAPILYCHSCLPGPQEGQHWDCGKDQKDTGVFLRCSHLTNLLCKSGTWDPECILFMMVTKYLLNFKKLIWGLSIYLLATPEIITLLTANRKREYPAWMTDCSVSWGREFQQRERTELNPTDWGKSF